MSNRILLSGPKGSFYNEKLKVCDKEQERRNSLMHKSPAKFSMYLPQTLKLNGLGLKLESLYYSAGKKIQRENGNYLHVHKTNRPAAICKRNTINCLNKMHLIFPLNLNCGHNKDHRVLIKIG